MSISQIQTKNILEFIAKSFFANGINPEIRQLQVYLNDFFSKNPVGTPLRVNQNTFNQNVIADPELINTFMATSIVNIDTLYEVCAQHLDDIMVLNTVLRTHLDRLKTMRRILEQKIDDFLLGIYNSDGYFYSFSDSFADTAFTDLQYTSAFIDTSSTTISLPSVTSLSRKINADALTEPSIVVRDGEGNPLTFLEKMPWINALDGMTNTAWYIEVRTPSPVTVTLDLGIQLSTALSDGRVTRIDLTPFGVTPVQCGVKATFLRSDYTRYTAPYCHQIKRSSDKMTFIGDQIEDVVDEIKLRLTKTEPDYVENTSNSKANVYMFGFKEILMTEQFYDASATFVSSPFTIPSEIQDEATVDAISLVVEDFIPTNTSLTYYVAENNTNAESIDDFDWRQITPIGANSGQAETVIHFNGSSSDQKIIRRTPRNSNDIKLIDFNTTSSDLSKRNPTPSYLPALDVYRITEFTDNFLAGTLSLEEGINTTKLYWTELDEDAISEGFTFWKSKFDDGEYSTSYGEIDSGHEFFYGADVGEDGKSIYVETFLNTDKEYNVFLKECRKSDLNSKTWDIRLFLNGREIANMPAGVDKLTVPWKLKEGLNHIVAMVNIPAATNTNPSPYIGTFNIMVDGNLSEFGTVKLNNWTYVDLYKFQNNQTNDTNTFTIYNNELISRKKPTNNFRLRFKKASSTAPESIRLRADFTRSSQYAKATPMIDSYRIRFAYK